MLGQDGACLPGREHNPDFVEVSVFVARKRVRRRRVGRYKMPCVIFSSPLLSCNTPRTGENYTKTTNPFHHSIYILRILSLQIQYHYLARTVVRRKSTLGFFFYFVKMILSSSYQRQLRLTASVAMAFQFFHGCLRTLIQSGMHADSWHFVIVYCSKDFWCARCSCSAIPSFGRFRTPTAPFEWNSSNYWGSVERSFVLAKRL